MSQQDKWSDRERIPPSPVSGGRRWTKPTAGAFQGNIQHMKLMGQAAPSTPLARRSPIAQKCPPLADLDRISYNCQDKMFCGKELLKKSAAEWSLKSMTSCKRRFFKMLWGMGRLHHGSHHSPGAGSSSDLQGAAALWWSQGFQFRSPCASKTSCFTALSAGIEKKLVFRAEFWIAENNFLAHRFPYC